MAQPLARTTTWLILSACLTTPLQAFAVSEYGKAVELAVTVVTATRSAQSLADAPAMVTVIDERQIEAKPVSRLGDALDQVPSLYLQNGAFGASQGTSGTSNLSLRGIDQSKVLILLDGQPIQDASSGRVNWRIPFMEDIERIEVVPGAFSSLYGSNAIGGVINVITKQPDTRELTLRISKGWQDMAGEDASIYFRDTLESGLGIVIGAGYQNRDSYVNDFVVKTPSAGAPGTAVTGWQAITTREGAPAYLVGDKGRTPWTSGHALLKLSYKFNARDKVAAGVSWQETNQDYTPYTTYLVNSLTGDPVATGIVGINGQRVSLSLADFVNNSPLQEGATRYFLNYEGSLGQDYMLKVDLARIDRKYSFSAPGTPASYEGGPGKWTDTPNSGLDGSVQLSFPAGDRHFWVAGLAFHGEEANQKVYALDNWRNPDSKSGMDTAYNGSSRTVSVFAQDEITVNDKTKAYLGGRWDHWRTEGDFFNSSPTPPTTLYPRRAESAFSPKASVVYRPVDAATLRASFGRAFRAPTNLDLYSVSRVGPLTIYNNPDLVPETASTWELGGEWRFSGLSKAGLTVYESTLKNLIYTKRVGFEINRLNAGKARIRGIELTGQTRLTRWLELSANYAWIDSEILENSFDTDSVGKRLTNSPEHIAGIALDAKHGPWSGTLSARYVSHVYFNSSNTDVVEGVPGSYDAHTLVNAKLGYSFTKAVKGSLAISNLLDEKAYSFFRLPGRSAVAELVFSL